MTRRTIAAAALAGLMVLPGASADAQTPGHAPGRGHAHALPLARMIEMYEALDLTAAQVERIRGISARLEQQNEPLRQQLEQAREKMMEERRGMSAADRERMVRERAARLDSARARIDRQRPAMDSMRARTQAMSPAQRDSMRARMQAMSPAQRDSMHDRMKRGGVRAPLGGRRPAALPEELRTVIQQMRANAQAAAAGIDATLTDAQRQKLEELRVRHRPDGARARPGAVRRSGAPAARPLRDRQDGQRPAQRGAR